MEKTTKSAKKLTSVTVKAVAGMIISIIFIAAVLFLPAGSLSFWEAWFYCGIVFIPMFFVMIYFLIKDPAFIERRLNFKEKEKEQKLIIKIGNILFLSGFLIPGFDYRYNWSEVNQTTVLIFGAFALIGYIIVIITFMANSYASRVVEVVDGQKIITTGIYSIIRHPMYLGVLIMYLSTPFVLGSLWSLIPFSLIIPILILRILNEEKVLKSELPGYTEYCSRTRKRLIPYLW